MPVAPSDPQETPPAAFEAPPEPASQGERPVEDLSPQAGDDDWDEDEDDEDGWGDEEDGDDEPDPFITGAPAPVDLASGDVEALRARARTEALGGEHRIYLSNPAGPGSLAEALNLLLGEGLVEAHFVAEADEGPHILYRPVP